MNIRERILELHAIGTPDVRIAEAVGFSVQAVRRTIRKAQEMPKTFYESLLVSAARMSPRTAHRATTKPMSRRRKSKAVTEQIIPSSGGEAK